MTSVDATQKSNSPSIPSVDIMPHSSISIPSGGFSDPLSGNL